VQQLASGARIQGADLSEVDWAERELEDLSLQDCVLTDVTLSAVMLRGASFVGCKFVRCRFAHVDLREARFERCSFVDVQNHGGVHIGFSRLDEARFVDCDLAFADIDRSTLYDVSAERCSFRGARFHRADFSRAFGRKVVRTAATFRSCNLQLVDLSDARLADADLSGSILREADLIRADLEGANLRNCDLVLAHTAGAKLARADLRGAKIGGLDVKALTSVEDAKITLDQAQDIVRALGLDLYA